VTRGADEPQRRGVKKKKKEEEEEEDKSPLQFQPLGLLLQREPDKA
jgi:hypothetical protein